MRARGSIALLFLLLAGCSLPSLSPDVYSRGEARRVHNVSFGEVVMVRSVQISGRSSAIGRFGGAYVGGAVGGTVGDGTGEDIATAVGAVAGAVAGEKVEEVATRSEGLELTIRLDNGKLITLVQSNEVEFTVGERVRVLASGNDRGRVLKY